jgi:predicted dehydrogenase
MRTSLTRRRLLALTAAAGASAVLPSRAQNAAAPAKKPLRVALIGCGVQGIGVHIPELCKERLVALVDPDSRQIAKAFKRIKELSPETDTAAVKTFSDYRAFFDAMGRELDAVTIASPNHQHALAALLAIRRGLHVYVEKPLTHTLAEARQLAEEARRHGVATQMGNQGQSSEGARLLCEYLQAGAVGTVKEVICWSDHANGFPAGHVRPPALPVPKELDWESWIGPAPFRDYHATLHLHTWHSWTDFGNGSLGNMGCHIMNHAYGALNLRNPSAVEAEEVYGGTAECWNVGTRLRWDFPALGGRAPVKMYWYDGLIKGLPFDGKTISKTYNHVEAFAQNFPPLVTELKKKYDRELLKEGSLLVGDKGTIIIGKHGDGCRLIPEEAHRAFPKPAKTLPRVKGSHFEDFFRACRGGAPACSNFDHAGPLAELVTLGNLAVRAGEGKRVDWDGPAMRCANRPDLDALLKTDCREGWRA